MPLSDEVYMRRALTLAQQAARLGEVPVGAVIVTAAGEIIGEGHNLREQSASPLTHAEIIAIDQAAAALHAWRLIGCTLYVTLEPCPMCAGAIINSRIGRVVYGAADPKAGACGSVVNLFEHPFNHQPQVIAGVLQRECAGILSDFFKSLRNRPR